jgi:hypothetical protein
VYNPPYASAAFFKNKVLTTELGGCIVEENGIPTWVFDRAIGAARYEDIKLAMDASLLSSPIARITRVGTVSLDILLDKEKYKALGYCLKFEISPLTVILLSKASASKRAFT